MKAKSWFLCAILLLAGLLTGGCEIFEEAMADESGSDDPTSDEFQPRFVIGIFSLVKYPRASNLEREVSNGKGESVWINTNQNFSSKRIKAVKMVPRPGDPDVCDLDLRIDRMGQAQWLMLDNGQRGEPVAFMVDSRFICTFIPDVPSDDQDMEWIRLRVGIDTYTARGIVRYAKKNYKHYNPRASDWFRF